jgi:hypothetical protein
MRRECQLPSDLFMDGYATAREAALNTADTRKACGDRHLSYPPIKGSQSGRLPTRPRKPKVPQGMAIDTSAVRWKVLGLAPQVGC